jgi:hypothetical protein
MRAAIGWFALTTVIFWLPAVRGAFDGPTYQWSLFGFGGRGVSGDYWFPLVGVCGALAVLAGSWRRRRWAFDTLSAWNVLLFVAIIALVTSSPDDFRFRGDTLGIDVTRVGWSGVVRGGCCSLFGRGVAGSPASQCRGCWMAFSKLALAGASCGSLALAVRLAAIRWRRQSLRPNRRASHHRPVAHGRSGLPSVSY